MSCCKHYKKHWLTSVNSKSSSWFAIQTSTGSGSRLNADSAISWQTNAASFCRLSHGAGTRYYHLEADGNYTHLHFIDAPGIMTSRPTGIWGNPDPAQFFQNTHPSIFIFLNLTALQKAVAILPNGKRLPVSRRRLEDFNECHQCCIPQNMKYFFAIMVSSLFGLAQSYPIRHYTTSDGLPVI